MQARLTIERGGAAPLSWTLDTDQIISLGRTRHNTVVLPDATVSRKHAEIYADKAGAWFVREAKNDVTNPTRVNGQRILGPTELHHNDEIAIGSARLRFTLDPSKDATDEFPDKDLSPPPSPGPATDVNLTVLHPDELTVLLHFMNDSLQETTPRGLIQLALSTVYNQTHAAVAGFLSLDPAEPLPRLVVPAEGQVEPHLSRHLTQLAIQAQRSVWLAKWPSTPQECQSLADFRDAVCVPLGASPALALPNVAQPKRTLVPLGALHVYKTSRPFTEREVQFCELLGNSLANNLRVLRERRVLEADISRLRERATACSNELIGKSAVMDRLRQQIAKLADGPGIILVNGESGVGKELVARALHKLSKRRDEPQVSVNCASIPAGLAESELFGHVDKAFNGAVRRQGYFEQADDGTLFLDEIGEMPMPLQAQLLRVLETGKIRPVGGEGEIEVNVRVVVATNRDLKKEVKNGNFRGDLLYRLGMTIHVPPLREHIEDVPELAAFFLARWNAEYHRNIGLTESALLKMQAFSWPGNVRELRSVLETAVATAEGEVIHAGDLHLQTPVDNPGIGLPSVNLEELEVAAIREVVKRTGGNNTKSAEMLGINRDTLIRKMKKYGIDRKE